MIRTLIEITEGGLKFSDGARMSDYHEHSCCEQVYADWEQIDAVIGQEFPNLAIELVEDSGIRVDGRFVPCYDIQSGYYSNNLAIYTVLPDGVTTVTDVSGCAEYKYDG